MLLRSLPRMSRPHAALELSVWALMGVLSGGVAGVLVDTVFQDSSPAWVEAIAVALIHAATGALTGQRGRGNGVRPLQVRART